MSTTKQLEFTLFPNRKFRNCSLNCVLKVCNFKSDFVINKKGIDSFIAIKCSDDKINLNFIYFINYNCEMLEANCEFDIIIVDNDIKVFETNIKVDLKSSRYYFEIIEEELQFVHLHLDPLEHL